MINWFLKCTVFKVSVFRIFLVRSYSGPHTDQKNSEHRVVFKTQKSMMELFDEDCQILLFSQKAPPLITSRALNTLLTNKKYKFFVLVGIIAESSNWVKPRYSTSENKICERRIEVCNYSHYTMAPY